MVNSDTMGECVSSWCLIAAQVLDKQLLDCFRTISLRISSIVNFTILTSFLGA